MADDAVLDVEAVFFAAAAVVVAAATHYVQTTDCALHQN